MSSASLSSASGGVRFTEQWVLDDARATYDDESGRVQLVVDVTVRATRPGTSTQTTSLMFQVTTLVSLSRVSCEGDGLRWAAVMAKRIEGAGSSRLSQRAHMSPTGRATGFPSSLKLWRKHDRLDARGLLALATK